MPRAIKKKVRKKNVGVENEVAGRLYDIKDQLKKKQKAVLTYGIGTVIVVFTIAGILLYRYTEGEKARQLDTIRERSSG